MAMVSLWGNMCTMRALRVSRLVSSCVRCTLRVSSPSWRNKIPAFMGGEEQWRPKMVVMVVNEMLNQRWKERVDRIFSPIFMSSETKRINCIRCLCPCSPQLPCNHQYSSLTLSLTVYARRVQSLPQGQIAAHDQNPYGPQRLSQNVSFALLTRVCKIHMNTMQFFVSPQAGSSSV